jgi:hypothetical protein
MKAAMGGGTPLALSTELLATQLPLHDPSETVTADYDSKVDEARLDNFTTGLPHLPGNV